MEQFRGIFKLLFKGYARHRGNQHMSEAGRSGRIPLSSRTSTGIEVYNRG